MSTITLRAVDLLSKWGFGDGDILESVWDELEAAGLSPFQDGVLEALVEWHLVPLLPAGSEVYRTSSHHNPIRIRFDEADEEVMRGILEPISVEVTAEQVITLARALAP